MAPRDPPEAAEDVGEGEDEELLERVRAVLVGPGLRQPAWKSITGLSSQAVGMANRAV